MDQAKRMKELEKENGKLKRLVAELALDKQILKASTPHTCLLRCNCHFCQFLTTQSSFTIRDCLGTGP
jgi:hypothetical protein